MNRSLERRVEELEGASDNRDAPAIVIVDPDEPNEMAEARYRAEHPNTSEHAQFVFFVSGFSRTPDRLAEISP